MAEPQTLLPWLLAARTPSIRYLALRQLLGRPATNPEVRVAREDMEAEGPIPLILAGQGEDGHWRHERSYYTPKYTATHWSLVLLAELAADQGTPGLRRGAAFMLSTTAAELRHNLTQGKHGQACFWGNLLRYALQGGLHADPTLAQIVEYLVGEAQQGWACPWNDGLPCAWGAARALWGLAALKGQQVGRTRTAIDRGLAFLLEEHDLTQGNYPTPGKAHPLWRRLSFPLFYQADILFVLRVVAELGALQRPGAQEALAWLRGQRRPDGRWRGTAPFKRRTWPILLDDQEEVDRWVSCHAAWVLQRAEEQR